MAALALHRLCFVDSSARNVRGQVHPRIAVFHLQNCFVKLCVVSWDAVLRGCCAVLHWFREPGRFEVWWPAHSFKADSSVWASGFILATHPVKKPVLSGHYTPEAMFDGLHVNFVE